VLPSLRVLQLAHLLTIKRGHVTATPTRGTNNSVQVSEVTQSTFARRERAFVCNDVYAYHRLPHCCWSWPKHRNGCCPHAPLAANQMFECRIVIDMMHAVLQERTLPCAQMFFINLGLCVDSDAQQFDLHCTFTLRVRPRTQLSLHTAKIATLSFSHAGHLARNEPALNDNTAHQHHTAPYSSTFASVGKLTTTAPACLVVNLARPEVTLASLAVSLDQPLAR
jgi:hypothetical protein